MLFCLVNTKPPRHSRPISLSLFHLTMSSTPASSADAAPSQIFVAKRERRMALEQRLEGRKALIMQAQGVLLGKVRRVCPGAASIGVRHPFTPAFPPPEARRKLHTPSTHRWRVLPAAQPPNRPLTLFPAPLYACMRPRHCTPCARHARPGVAVDPHHCGPGPDDLCGRRVRRGARARHVFRDVFSAGRRR